VKERQHTMLGMHSAALLALACSAAVVHIADAKSTSSIYTNIYVQECHSCVGKMSLHFDSAADSYVSWSDDSKTMTDGAGSPSKHPFTNFVYSSASRSVTGNTDFAPNSMVMVEGDATKNVEKWTWSMTFSKDFQSITSGSLRGFAPNSTTVRYTYSFCDESMTSCPAFTAKQATTGTQYLRYIRYKKEEFDDILEKAKALNNDMRDGRQHDQAHMSFVFFNFCLIIVSAIIAVLIYKIMPR
jgi:hypothetical protein